MYTPVEIKIQVSYRKLLMYSWCLVGGSGYRFYATSILTLMFCFFSAQRNLKKCNY
jgi:hypothetical protein